MHARSGAFLVLALVALKLGVCQAGDTSTNTTTTSNSTNTNTTTNTNTNNNSTTNSTNNYNYNYDSSTNKTTTTKTAGSAAQNSTTTTGPYPLSTNTTTPPKEGSNQSQANTTTPPPPNSSSSPFSNNATSPPPGGQASTSQRPDNSTSPPPTNTNATATPKNNANQPSANSTTPPPNNPSNLPPNGSTPSTNSSSPPPNGSSQTNSSSSPPPSNPSSPPPGGSTLPNNSTSSPPTGTSSNSSSPLPTQNANSTKAANSTDAAHNSNQTTTVAGRGSSNTSTTAAPGGSGANQNPSSTTAHGAANTSAANSAQGSSSPNPGGSSTPAGQNPDKTSPASGSSSTAGPNQSPPPYSDPSGSQNNNAAAGSNMPPAGSCEDVYLKPNYNPALPVQRLNYSGKIVNVSCRYDDPSVCNMPLLKAFANKMGLTVDGSAKPNAGSAPPIFMGWQLNATQTLPNSTVINVTFFGTVQIRQITTAWQVVSFCYTNTNGSSVCLAVNSTVAAPTFVLPMPVLATHIDVALKKRDGQTVPFFDVRGCNVTAGASFTPPPPTAANAFANVQQKGRILAVPRLPLNNTNVKNASMQCSGIDSNATLMIVDSPDMWTALVASIKMYDTNFSTAGASGNFLIGLSRSHGGVWTYANGKPLGNYTCWAPNEPSVSSYGRNCVVVNPATNYSWTTANCSSLGADVRPVCQLLPPPLQVAPPLQTLGCISPQNLMSNVTTPTAANSSQCTVACRAIKNQWALYDASAKKCYCKPMLEYGFLPAGQCSTTSSSRKKRQTSPSSNVTATSTMATSCPALSDLPNLNLYLTNNDPNFALGSNATFTCAQGYSGGPVTTMCQTDSTWSVNVSSLPNTTCKPVYCNAPVVPASTQGWTIDYSVKINSTNSSGSLMGTAFVVTCPANIYFPGQVGQISAECTSSGNWSVNSSLACSNGQTSCPTLALSSLACQMPNCSDAATALNLTANNATVANNVTDVSAGTNISAVCSGNGMSFRMPNNSSLSSIAATCTFNSTSGSSQWLWSYGSTPAAQVSVPACASYCSSQPPSVANATQWWDGGQWDNASLAYQCAGSLVLSVPGAQQSRNWTVKCHWDSSSGQNTWQTVYNATTFFAGALTCGTTCSSDPINTATKYNRTWAQGLRSVGATATYACLNSNQSFYSVSYYKTIAFVCTASGNTTAWLWNDKGTYKNQTQFPPCMTAPDCGPLQTQLDPTRSYGGKYINVNGTSFISVSANIVPNATLPLGTTGNATCFFAPNQFRVETTLQPLLGVECAYNASAGGSNWIFRRKDTNGVLNSLPPCDSKCSTPPVTMNGLQLAWNGDLWEGTTANYTCSDPSALISVGGSKKYGASMITTECSQVATMQPWWNGEYQLGACSKNLTEGNI